MADGFEAHPESAAQQVDIVVQFLCGMMELAIGQQECAGEVVGQTDAGDAAGFGAEPTSVATVAEIRSDWVSSASWVAI